MISQSINAGLDPYDFRPRRLADKLSTIATVVDIHNMYLTEVGLDTVLDSHYEAIADGLALSRLPESEADLLRSLAFSNVADHLSGILYMVREGARERIRRTRDVRPLQILRRIPEDLEKAADNQRQLDSMERRLADLEDADRDVRQKAQAQVEQLRREVSNKKKSRRWFKGVGQIVQGTAMSMANIALAAGALRFPVLEETRSWSALVSVTAGVGTMMNGAGDLRGE